MTRTATQHSSRFDANIEYNPTDPLTLNVDDQDREVMTYWGIDDNGTCYFLTFINDEYYDGLTEEA